MLPIDVLNQTFVSFLYSSKMSPAAKGSKRSISSITAPERLKSALKEKEQEIEKMMKERQLERAEIGKAF